MSHTTIITNARTWIIHAGVLHDDAERIAQNIGKRTFLVTGRSHVAESEPLADKRERLVQSPVWDYMIPPHEIRGLAGEHALVLTIEDREVLAPVRLRKPRPLSLTLVPHEAPDVSPYPPPTVWEEDALNVVSPDELIPTNHPGDQLSLPAGDHQIGGDTSAREATPDW